MSFSPFPSLLLVLSLGFLGACNRPALTLATTTSTYDSGLLAVLLPPFEKGAGVKVKVVAVGTGQALELGRRGDTDVLLVHDPEGEERFMAEGYGSQRLPVMHNDFVLLGPSADPAGVRGSRDAAGALAAIARRQVPFASRGDDSGTHRREKALWAQVVVNPAGQGWYLSLGQGMGETLAFASEKGAYTLSDRGSYLALRARRAFHLEVMVEGDERLFNRYSVIVVNPAHRPLGKSRLPEQLADYLTSPRAQGLIRHFGVEQYGEPLFFPEGGK